MSWRPGHRLGLCLVCVWLQEQSAYFLPAKLPLGFCSVSSRIQVGGAGSYPGFTQREGSSWGAAGQPWNRHQADLAGSDSRPAVSSCGQGLVPGL